jgi:hypothetical protein
VVLTVTHNTPRHFQYLMRTCLVSPVKVENLSTAPAPTLEVTRLYPLCSNWPQLSFLLTRVGFSVVLRDSFASQAQHSYPGSPAMLLFGGFSWNMLLLCSIYPRVLTRLYHYGLMATIAGWRLHYPNDLLCHPFVTG